MWKSWLLYPAVDEKLVMLMLLPKEKYHHPKDKKMHHAIASKISCTQQSVLLQSKVHFKCVSGHLLTLFCGFCLFWPIIISYLKTTDIAAATNKIQTEENNIIPGTSTHDHCDIMLQPGASNDASSYCVHRS